MSALLPFELSQSALEKPTCTMLFCLAKDIIAMRDVQQQHLRFQGACCCALMQLSALRSLSCRAHLTPTPASPAQQTTARAIPQEEDDPGPCTSHFFQSETGRQDTSCVHECVSLHNSLPGPHTAINNQQVRAHLGPHLQAKVQWVLQL